MTVTVGKNVMDDAVKEVKLVMMVFVTAINVKLRNWVNSHLGVTWLIILREGVAIKWVLGTLIYGRVKLKKWEVRFEQHLIYTHPFPPLSAQFFYLPLFNSVANRKPFLGRKNIEGAFIPLPSQVTSLSLGTKQKI